jgi:hypothetical protein
MIITLVFKKNANFCTENWEKSQKIVIITLTPGFASSGPEFCFKNRAQVLIKLQIVQKQLGPFGRTNRVHLMYILVDFVAKGNFIPRC